MFISLLNKEFKQFVRKKSNVVLLFVFPIVLITTLALGLDSVMNGNLNIFGSEDEKSVVYYSVEDNSQYKDGFNTFKDAVSDEVTIDFKEDKLDNVKDEIDSYDAVAFVKVTEDGFSMYTSKNGDDTKSKVFKQIMDNVLNNFSIYKTIAEEDPMAMMNVVESKIEDVLNDETDDLRNSSSSEYYTFAELALIILYVSTITSLSTFKEKELTTINRVRLSKVSEGKMIFAKVIFGTLIGVVQTVLVWAYSSVFLNVNWGENTFKFILLFIALALFASMAGVVVGVSVNKEGAATGILNAVIIFICAFGGCYAPLYEITTSKFMATVCKLSPIYWISTSTNSMICGIKTDSYIIALIVPIALSIIMLVIYLLINKKRGALSDV